MLKRYLAFHGETFYPEQGMGNFVGDFDDMTEAVNHVNALEVAECRYYDKENPDANWKYAHRWGCVWDSEIRKNAWESA
jgi:hypothetical protein